MIKFFVGSMYFDSTLILGSQFSITERFCQLLGHFMLCMVAAPWVDDVDVYAKCLPFFVCYCSWARLCVHALHADCQNYNWQPYPFRVLSLCCCDFLENAPFVTPYSNVMIFYI